MYVHACTMIKTSNYTHVFSNLQKPSRQLVTFVLSQFVCSESVSRYYQLPSDFCCVDNSDLMVFLMSSKACLNFNH
jgi:hypothetical protein